MPPDGSKQKVCSFADCGLPGEAAGLCFWHDPESDKRAPDVRERLEAVAKSGGSMAGFELAYADLRDAHLTRGGDGRGYDLSCANLSHTDLRGAHLFRANFSDASLMKTRFEDANLNHSIMHNANLLGAVLTNAKIEHVAWGQRDRHDRMADAARAKGDRQGELDNCGEAEEIYRDLRKHAEMTGHFDEAGHFFVREMIMRRYQMRLWSVERFFSKAVDLFCGYGERPFRVVICSLLLIFGCALLFFATGVAEVGGVSGYDGQVGTADNLENFLNILYFSVVTFTTLGYGDISPVGIARLIAAIEAFLGTFVMALFVVVFVKKMTR